MRYVIGGGLAGMIFAYYNPKYLIISPELGGQAAESFNLGPRLLEYDKDTEELLKELGLNSETEVIKVGFYNEGFTNPSLSFKKFYLETSRGKTVKEVSGMNSMKHEMKVFKTSFKELSDALAKKLISRHIPNNILKIKESSQKIELSEKDLPYHHLVVTLPYSTYANLSGRFCEKPTAEYVTFVKLKESFFDMKDYNFIYFLNKPFYRVSKHSDYLVAEFRVFNPEVFSKHILEFKTIRTQVESTETLSASKSVLLFGRFAEQDKSIKTEHLIKKAKLYKGVSLSK